MKNVLLGPSITVCILSITLAAAAQHDTTQNGHIKIVAPKYNFKTPKIKDPRICEKFQAIRIPDKLKFVDSDGSSRFYFIEIDLYFDRRGILVCKRKENNNLYLNKLSNEILLILKNEIWSVNREAHYHLIKFNCNVFKTGLSKVSFTSQDNADVVEICK